MRTSAKGRLASVACVLAVCVGGSGTSQSASAATLSRAAEESFLAIYANPGAAGNTAPVGGGEARSFGYGENMMFEASSQKGIGESLVIDIASRFEDIEDTIFGATLQSNKTGTGVPLGLAFQFVDGQDAGVPLYSDTGDHRWMASICGVKEEGQKECRVSPTVKESESPGDTVKIEDVGLRYGGNVIQGTMWGKWQNGRSKVAPCIRLELPPEGENQNGLVVTQGNGLGVVGTAVSLKGEMCLVSAGNEWFAVGGAEEEPAITVTNE
jgi:hypothetical protein